MKIIIAIKVKVKRYDKVAYEHFSRNYSQPQPQSAWYFPCLSGHLKPTKEENYMEAEGNGRKDRERKSHWPERIVKGKG